MIKSPYCRYEGEFRSYKSWCFKFYDVRRLERSGVMEYLTTIVE